MCYFFKVISLPHCTMRGSTKYDLRWEFEHKLRNIQKCGIFMETKVMNCDRAEASTSIKLRLFCRGDEKEAENFVSLHIVADPAVDIQLLHYDVLIRNWKNVSLLLMDQLKNVKDGYVRISKLVSWDKVFNSEEGFVPEKVLSISVTVTIFDYQKPLDMFTYMYKELDDPPLEEKTGDLAGNLGHKMLFNKAFTDVTIRAGGEDIPAHGCILSASWPYFSTNFWPLCSSKHPLVLCVDLVEAEQMKEILRYLYTGVRPQLDNQSAMSMMKAAVNNRFDRLRDVCKEYLIDHLNNDIAVEALIMADKFKMMDLKKICIHILLKRENLSWMDALHNYGDIMLEIVKQSKEDPSCRNVNMEME